MKDLVEVICFHWKNKYYFFPKFHSFFSKPFKNIKIFVVSVNHFCLWKMTIVLTRSMKKQMNEVLQWEDGEGNFIKWIRKALLLCILHNSKRSESTLKNDNYKYKLTLEFIQWSDCLWLWMQNLCGAMFGPLLKMMFFGTKRLLYLVLDLKKLKISTLKDNRRSKWVFGEGYFWN